MGPTSFPIGVFWADAQCNWWLNCTDCLVFILVSSFIVNNNKFQFICEQDVNKTEIHSPTIAMIASTARTHSCLGVFVGDQYVLGAADCIDEIRSHPIIVRNPGGPFKDWLPGSREVGVLVWMGTCWKAPRGLRWMLHSRINLWQLLQQWQLTWHSPLCFDSSHALLFVWRSDLRASQAS